MIKFSEVEDLKLEIVDRDRELNCLYRVDEILNSNRYSPEETLKWLCKTIPQGWRYSDICKVKIEYEGMVVSTPGFKNTELKMMREIIVESLVVGTITIVYVKPIYAEKGIFLQKEHKMLSVIASKIASYIVFQKMKNALDDLQTKTKSAKQGEKDFKVKTWLRQQMLSDSEIEKMLTLKIHFKKGETICKQGALATYVVLISDGLSKNYLEGNQEKGFNFKIIKPYDFIGLSSLYGKNVYGFSGSALTNCEAFLIDVHTMKNIISTNHHFATRVMNWYCNVTHTHLKRLSSIANKQALGRLVEILFYLSDEIFNGPILTNIISRKDIAELAAMSTEASVRFLSDLKKDKIIDIHPNRIDIINRKTLEMIHTSA